MSLEQLMVIGMIITVVYNVMILLYIMKLEDKSCECIRDWRHDFIKYFTTTILIWSVVSFAFGLNKNKNELVMVIQNLLMCVGLINLWCLYTYVGDLDRTKCSCAIDGQKKTHYFLYIWRYFGVALLIVALVGVIMKTLIKQ